MSPSGASNQVHLQGLHALKSGIMVGAQLRRQFNDCGVQFNNQQIRLGKQRLKTIEAVASA